MQRTILKSAQEILFDQILELQDHILRGTPLEGIGRPGNSFAEPNGDLHKLNWT